VPRNFWFRLNGPDAPAGVAGRVPSVFDGEGHIIGNVFDSCHKKTARKGGFFVPVRFTGR